MYFTCHDSAGVLASLLGTKGIATNGAGTLLVASGITTGNKKLLGAPGIATRSKDATRGSWPY